MKTPKDFKGTDVEKTLAFQFCERVAAAIHTVAEGCDPAEIRSCHLEAVGEVYSFPDGTFALIRVHSAGDVAVTDRSFGGDQ